MSLICYIDITALISQWKDAMFCYLINPEVFLRKVVLLKMKCFSSVLYFCWLAGSFPGWRSHFRTSSFCDPLKWIQSFNSWSGSQFWDFPARSWKGPFRFRVLELLASVQDGRVVCLLPEVRSCTQHVLFGFDFGLSSVGKYMIEPTR